MVPDRPRPALLDEGPLPLFIGGEFVAPHSGRWEPTIDPTTQKPLTTVAVADAEDIDAAVRAARAAFVDPSWSAITPQRRTELLLQIAYAIEAHGQELAILDSLEMGGALWVNQWLVGQCVDVLRHYAGWPTKIYGQTAPSDPTKFHYTVREPLGVVAGITAWNGPLQQLCWKLGAALSTGNTFVHKPALWSSLSAIRLAQIIAAGTDLPAGVFNVVSGDGAMTGQALIEHPGVDKISFTGSVATGRHILRTSAVDLKRVTLELGGKSPTIVFDDADLPAAAQTAAAAFCQGSGQGCVAGSRIFVQESIKDEFRDLLLAAMDSYVAGDPFAEGTQMGPLASREHFDRVNGYLDLARQEGASVHQGGDWQAEGLFMRPALLENVTPDMRVIREEIFGPLSALMTFTDIEDAIAKGNDTSYGLSASIWTRDFVRTQRTAAGLRVGTVWVNTYADMSTGTVPFGGFKTSGLGREHGTDVLDAYTETKTVMVTM
ncbi:aldehyde dehydrogenase family protein [Streptomyces canus]